MNTKFYHIADKNLFEYMEVSVNCLLLFYLPSEGGWGHYLPANQQGAATALPGRKVWTVDQSERGGAHGTGEAEPETS